LHLRCLLPRGLQTTAGRDATSSGDRVMAESYFQHAEHYFRIIGAINQATANQQGQQGGQAPQAAPPPAPPQHNGPRRTLEQELEQEIGDDDGEDEAPGMGDQPTLREIPIAVAPPVGED